MLVSANPYPWRAPCRPYYWYIVYALAALTLVAVVGILVWRRLSKRPRFDVMEEERREEKAALAESMHEDQRESDPEGGTEMESKGGHLDKDAGAGSGGEEEGGALRESSAPHL